MKQSLLTLVLIVSLCATASVIMRRVGPEKNSTPDSAAALSRPQAPREVKDTLDEPLFRPSATATPPTVEQSRKTAKELFYRLKIRDGQVTSPRPEQRRVNINPSSLSSHQTG